MSKNKIKFDDTLFRSLLMDYKKEESNFLLEKNINLLVDDYYSEKENKKKNIFNLFPLIPSISFAVVLLIIVFFIMIQLFFPINLNKKLLITKYNNNIENVKNIEYITKNTFIKAGEKEEIKIQTEQALFFLKENSSFKVKRLVYNKSDYYYLEYGDIYVDADNLKKYEHLEIKTKQGMIKVVGTKFEIISGKNILSIKCFEGKVDFLSNDIKFKKQSIDAGNELIFNNNKFKIESIKNPVIRDIKRDISGKLEDKIKNIKFFDLKTDKSDANIYINNNFSGNGDVRYLFNEKENISISVKLDGYEDINEEVILENSKKMFYQMKKNNLEKNILNKQLKINWNIKLDKNKYISINLLKDFIALISQNNITFVYKKNGAVLKKIKRENNQEGHASYENNFAFYEAPGKVKIIKLPELKELYMEETGPIAFGQPAINGQYLIVASTDHNIYIYDYIEKKLINKYNSEAGFYCIPFIIKDKIILNNLAKMVMVYSIKDNKIIWEKKNNFRFISELPLISANNKIFAMKDEESKLFIYNLDDGVLLNTLIADKKIPSCFIGNDLLVYNNTGLSLYKENKILTKIKIKEQISGFFVFDDIIYLIYHNRIAVLNKSLEKINEIGIKRINLFDSKDGELFLMSSDNELIKISLNMQGK